MLEAKNLRIKITLIYYSRPSATILLSPTSSTTSPPLRPSPHAFSPSPLSTYPHPLSLFATLTTKWREGEGRGVWVATRWLVEKGRDKAAKVDGRVGEMAWSGGMWIFYLVLLKFPLAQPSPFSLKKKGWAGRKKEAPEG